MKINIKNPILVYLAKNTWIFSFTLMFCIFTGGIFQKSFTLPTAVLIIISLITIVLGVLSIIYYATTDKKIQKNEYDERAQLIIGKASEWASAITICTFMLISLVALLLEKYNFGLVVLIVSFANKLLLEVLRAIFSRKY